MGKIDVMVERFPARFSNVGRFAGHEPKFSTTVVHKKIEKQFILFYFDRIVLFYLYSLFFLESQHEVPCVHLGKFYIKASIN